MSQSDTDRAHTPTPWRVMGEDEDAGGPFIEIAAGNLPSPEFVSICEVRGDEVGEKSDDFELTDQARANAAFIIRAVNSHDALVSALRDARVFVQMNVDELLSSCCLTGADGKYDRSTIDHLDKSAIDDAEGCLAKIDAALAGVQS